MLLISAVSVLSSFAGHMLPLTFSYLNILKIQIGFFIFLEINFSIQSMKKGNLKYKMEQSSAVSVTNFEA